MSTRRNKRERLLVVTAWPNDDLSDEEFARWVETHSLEKLIGTAEHVPVKPRVQTVLKGAQRKREAFERLLFALHIARKDVEAVHRIAQRKDIPYSELLRSWIREGLRREQRRAAG
ncbi:MAG: hypothetical protein HYZ72_08660 [Deltaproteobacteria bacterium]|nr:hypothetical protein [Deltaproteobacteria bacterium]